MIEGILLIALGILAVALPAFTTFSIVLLLGWILLIGGIVHLYRALRHIKTSSFWLSLINSLVAIVIGILLLVYPLSGMVFLTLMLGIFFLFEGVTEIALAIHLKAVSANWGWLLASGILALILSLIIWSGWPKNSAWVVGLLVGINLFFFGFSLMLFAGNRREN
jgi:uncharacterized membrane protein HdeD (DUF308 family)